MKVQLKIYNYLKKIIMKLFFNKNPLKTNYLYNKNYLITNIIEILKKSGFTPKLIIDVGANHGTWFRIWKNAYPNSNFVIIEPQSWLKSSFIDLIDDNTVYLPIGAGNANGDFLFTINSERDDSSTFTFSDKEALVKGFKQIKIPVKTLNTIVNENCTQKPDIVKIDAEGLDIEVLEGATDLFGHTEIFFVEANINAGFKQCNILNMLNFMDKKGYRVFDLTDLNRPFNNNVLWLVEIAFIRKGGYIDKLNWSI